MGDVAFVLGQPRSAQRQRSEEQSAEQNIPSYAVIIPMGWGQDGIWKHWGPPNGTELEISVQLQF